MSLRVDPNQAHRELSAEPTFMSLRRPDHRHRLRLSRFVPDAIKVASASLPHAHHALQKVLVLTILAQVSLSKTLYYYTVRSGGVENRRKSSFFSSGRRVRGQRAGGAGSMRDVRGAGS